MPEDEEPVAWQSIAQELLTHKHQSETLAEQRPIFEEFLAKFPTAVSLTCCAALDFKLFVILGGTPLKMLAGLLLAT